MAEAEPFEVAADLLAGQPRHSSKVIYQVSFAGQTCDCCNDYVGHESGECWTCGAAHVQVRFSDGSHKRR